MRVRAKKALADLRIQRKKTLLLWVAILVGATMVIAAFGARSILHREIERSFQDTIPPAIIVWTQSVSPELLEKVRKIPGVEAADARRMVRARAKVASGEWRALMLYGVRDFENISVSKIYPVRGAWPPKAGSMLLERSGLSVLRADVGDALSIRVQGQSAVHSLFVSGISHDPAQAPGWQDNVGYAYVSASSLAALGLGSSLDQLRLSVKGDRQTSEKVAQQVKVLLEGHGEVRRIEVPPKKHPHADHMGAMLILLQVLSVLSLLLSGGLTANLIAATLAKQVRQIGVMKALGASRRSISFLYFLMVGLIAGPAVFFAVPIGVVIAKRFSVFAGGQLNLALRVTDPSAVVVFAVALAAFLVPVLAASIPIAFAMRISAREAIHHTGLDFARVKATGGASEGLLARFALRNTFRRPARLWLTLFSFAIGGAMLMTASNVYTALVKSVDHALDSRGDDLEVRLLKPVPEDVLGTVLRTVDGVRSAQLWGAVLAGVKLPKKAGVAGRYGVLAPAQGRMHPGAFIYAGEWLNASAQLVINRQLAALEPSLKVGAQAVLYVKAQRVRVTVVGQVEELAPPTAYVLPSTMSGLIGERVGAARIVTLPGKAAEVASRTEDSFAAKGWFPAYLMTRATFRRALVDHFMILFMVLLAIALSALLVGILGLVTTMSLNVMERYRELGVLRSLGAGHQQVRGLLLLEGAAITGLSILVAMGLSVPLTLLVNQVVGQHGLHMSLPFALSLGTIVAWVVVAVVATALSCLSSAQHVVRRSVYELIAYER